jgi:hypothetical protein
MEPLIAAMKRARIEWLEAVMYEADYCVSAAAESVGMNRTQFYGMVKRYLPDAKPKYKAKPRTKECSGKATGGNAAWRALDE